MKWILILGLLVSFNAQAWEMDRFGFSYGANQSTKRGDGNWRQDGTTVSYKRFDKTGTYAYEIGGKTNVKWLRWSAEYFNRGATGIKGIYIASDEAYFNKDWDYKHFNGLLESTSRGFTFTLDPHFRYKNITVYAQIGVSLYNAKTKYCIYNNNGERSLSNISKSECIRSSQKPVRVSKERGIALYHARGVE